MNDVATTTKPAAVDRAALRNGAQSLEDWLLTLAKYGKPRVSHLGSGWCCTVDMYVSAAGVEFNVKSDFGHSSPTKAVIECAARLDKALSDVGA